MTEAELDEIEARLGIELPAVYRAVMLDYPFPPDSWPAQAVMPNGASFLVSMNERLADEAPPGWKPGHFAFGQDGSNTFSLELGVTSPPVLKQARATIVFEFTEDEKRSVRYEPS